MVRIVDVDPDRVEKRIRAVLEAQAARWGVPLLNHLIYARRPSIFHGARSMWSGLDASGLLDPGLVALVNRRVATLNAAVGSELGIPDEKLLALEEYADAITFSDRDVDDG